MSFTVALHPILPSLTDHQRGPSPEAKGLLRFDDQPDAPPVGARMYMYAYVYVLHCVLYVVCIFECIYNFMCVHMASVCARMCRVWPDSELRRRARRLREESS